MKAPRAAVGAALLMLAASACGGAAAVERPLKVVPAEIVPPTLDIGGENGRFTLEEYPKAREQFAQAGTKSLVADGRLWELRRGATLVGTLQVSTLKPNVEVAKRKQRDQLLGLVLPGTYTAISVTNVAVYETTDQQLTTYLWFGNEMFEVLQLKGVGFQPETVLRAALKFQIPTKALTIPGYEANRPKKK